MVINGGWVGVVLSLVPCPTTGPPPWGEGVGPIINQPCPQRTFLHIRSTDVDSEWLKKQVWFMIIMVTELFSSTPCYQQQLQRPQGLRALSAVPREQNLPIKIIFWSNGDSYLLRGPQWRDQDRWHCWDRVHLRQVRLRLMSGCSRVGFQLRSRRQCTGRGEYDSLQSLIAYRRL